MPMQKKPSHDTTHRLRMGTGFGKGHGGNSTLPPLVEKPLPPHVQQWIREGQMEAGTKLYEMGQCSIFASPPQSPDMGWHLSIAHPKRYPTWDEVAKARYELLPLDETFVMVLPRPADYVNVHNFCFHLWEDGKRRVQW